MSFIKIQGIFCIIYILRCFKSDKYFIIRVKNILQVQHQKQKDFIIFSLSKKVLTRELIRIQNKKVIRKLSQFQFVIKTHTHIIKVYKIYKKKERKKICIIDLNNKGCNVYVFCVMNSRWEIDKSLCFGYFFQIKILYLIILYYSNFHSFFNVFALD